jgi:hypothetical protein
MYQVLADKKCFSFWGGGGGRRIWALLSGTFSDLLPIWESRKEVAQIIILR